MKAARSYSAAPDAIDAKLQSALLAHDWPLLEKLCRQALRKNARHLRAHRMLGFSLHKQRRTEDALTAYKQGAALWPDDAELLINYANVLLENLRNDEASPLLERVSVLRGDHAMAWVKLAQCWYDTRQHEKGLEAAEKAVGSAKNPTERVAALNQRAIHRRELGQIREAVRDSEEAIALNPLEPANHANRLLFMLADPDADAQQLTRAAREYAAVFEPVLKPQWPDFASQRHGPWRRLKVGFLSPDFRTHSVMYFVEGLLAQLDRRQFEVWAFYLYPQVDAVTERVRCHADHFVPLDGMNATAQAHAIRAQGIDILIDLAGHTGHNALLAMAHRAAPVQVSWLGYPATSGLSAMDYKFTDEVTDPPDADDQYSERLYRLPTLFCSYRPMSRQPLWRYQPLYQVRPTPALQSGHVTFGSCNNLGKLTDEVLALWGQLLHTVPGSRLLIEGKNFDKPAFTASYRERCARLGMDVAQLDLVPLDVSNQYLTYHRIDIALDPFPLTGGTTTFDLLWMGVPLVSMEGDSFKSRLSTGILTYLGRSEWLAQNAQDYVRIAARLAADVTQLNALRLGLRQEVERSVLMREDLFNHHFGEGLRLMWLQWLAQGQHPGDPEAQSHLIESWLPDLPAEWSTPLVPGVGLAPGERVPLPEAQQRLQTLLETARTQAPGKHGNIGQGSWAEVTRLAEQVLAAVPQDPVALACLAEVEHAHGHTEFAVTYLRYAQEALGRAAQ
ncbi:tetratricopeptide repeat protein [Methyloversatilis sp.]|uniref:O-linked N-acetylglucosamine transferase, SPINDLY family protein n=1 Tax=Methyloversatilis sp. TaxID=2569862 RepID=UPI002734A7A4|nr:tetratricopeptide repeat protein [Methyloversatilis sp.]MDP3577813.1 tetratricopeptide repeat protein [Methyloversatilis sp.]